MKKLLTILIVAFAFISLPTLAQDVKFGVRGGLSLTDWSGQVKETLTELSSLSDISELGAGVSYHLGTYMEIPIGTKVVFEPGIQYSKKQVSVNAELADNFGDVLGLTLLYAQVDYTSHYVDVPLMLKVYPTKGFNVFAGPQFSYLISNSVDVEAGVLGFNSTFKLADLTDQLRTVDVALTGGVGYKFENGFNINASYDVGLSSLDKNDQFDLYNRVVKFSVGYTF